MAAVEDFRAMSKELLVSEVLKLQRELEKKKRPQEGEKKHVLGLTNPLLFAPSQYNRDILQINEPFLTFINKPPPTDKVRNMCMDEDALTHAMKIMLLRHTIPEDRVSKSRKNEMTLKAWHQSFLTGCWHLTTPSPDFAKTLKRLRVENEGSDEVEDEDELKEPYFVMEEPETEGGSGNTVGLRISNVPNVQDSPKNEEETEEDEDEPGIDNDSSSGGVSMDGTLEITRKDFSVRVWVPSLNDWVTVLAVEGKELLNAEGMFQVLRYSCKEGLLNLDKGRIAPIHVMQWSSDEWKYGVLDIYGSVTLRNGTITEDSWRRFCGQQRQRWVYLGNDPDKFKLKFTKEKLTEKLKSRLAWMRAKCKSDPNITYPDKDYLVAYAYVDDKPFSLPGTHQAGDSALPDARRFYESLLKIIIGKRVIKWTKEHVDRAVGLRDTAVEEIAQALLNVPKRRRTF